MAKSKAELKEMLERMDKDYRSLVLTNKARAQELRIQMDQVRKEIRKLEPLPTR